MSIADRLAENLAAKMAVSGVERMDLTLQDYAVAKDGGSARILVGFDRKLKAPTSNAIAKFVSTRFDGKLQANLATAVELSDLNAVSLIVTSMTKTRPLSDLNLVMSGTNNVKQLTPVIANTLYLDQVIGSNWQICTNPETGAKYLAQTRTEDVAGMLEKARVRHATASFGKAQTAVAFIMPEAGDYVEFFADQGLRQGEVSRVKGDEATIVDEGGATYIVEQQNVTRMLRKNTKSTTKHENALIQALIPTMVDPKLAEELVRGMRK